MKPLLPLPPLGFTIEGTCSSYRLTHVTSGQQVARIFTREEVELLRDLKVESYPQPRSSSGRIFIGAELLKAIERKLGGIQWDVCPSCGSLQVDTHHDGLICLACGVLFGTKDKQVQKSEDECPHCGGLETREVLTPHLIHHGKLECADCGHFFKWIPKPTTGDREDVRELIDRLIPHTSPNTWNRSFLNSIQSKLATGVQKSLSPKQLAQLNRIDREVGR